MSSSFEYNNMVITWLHHASFLIQAGGENVYIDPFKLTESVSVKNDISDNPPLPQADYILISHDHFDHFDEEAIAALSRKSTKLLAAKSVRKANMVDVTLEPGGSAKLGDWLVHSVPAYNIGKPFHQKEAGNCGFLVERNDVVIYHAGDTDWIPEMSALHKRVNVALLPIGGTYTMAIDDAIKAVATIAPEVVTPMHYNALDETRVTEEQLTYFLEGAAAHCNRVVILTPKLS